MKKLIAASFIFISLLYTACKSTPSCLTVVPPEINLTGEKTVIERQIVGDYKEIEKDAWTVSSVKSSVSSSQSETVSNIDIIKDIHLQNQSANTLRQYKDQGAVGEGYDGFLYYIENAEYEKSPEKKKELLAFIEKENKTRKEIFIKTLKKSRKTNPSNEEIISFGKIYAQEQRALALKGDWIQDKNGKWSRK